MLLVITGPAGAGKSTVSKELAKRFDRSVRISADTIKHFVVKGFIYGNEPEGEAQWELLGENAGKLLKSYIEAGYVTIFSGYFNNPAWKKMHDHVTPDHQFLLLPNLEVIQVRDGEREEEMQMGKEMTQRHHEHFSTDAFYNDFIKIDSSEHDVEKTVQTIFSNIH